MKSLVCVRCDEKKPAEAFVNDRTRPSGKFPWCKPCVLQYRRERKEPLLAGWSLWLGPCVAAGFYVLRELDQILYRIVDRELVDWRDAFMDAAVPTGAVYLFGWFMEFLT